MFCMAMSLFATSAFAQLQEVRGIETRRVEYDGPSYKAFCGPSDYSTKYYGWEFHNLNSIKVSVDIELWVNYGLDKVKVATKTIVLKPNEKYIFKQEDISALKKHELNINYTIEDYYIEYKAYKLQ